MWWLEALIASYLGLASLARANHRFRALPVLGNRVARLRAARILGWTLLIATAVFACHALGLAQGLVAFALVVAVAGIPLTLLLSVRPRLALGPTSLLLLPASVRRHSS